MASNLLAFNLFKDPHNPSNAGTVPHNIGVVSKHSTFAKCVESKPKVNK